MRSTLFLLLFLLLSGCAKEVARLPLRAEGAASTRVTLRAGSSVELWADLDVTFAGSFAARYHVALLDSHGQSVSAATCDPFDIDTKLKGLEETFEDGHQAIRYHCRMRCELLPPATAEYTVRAQLEFPGKATRLQVRDMTLVVKQ